MNDIEILINSLKLAHETWHENSSKEKAIQELIEACRFALMGYRNLLDLNLLPDNKDDTKEHIKRLDEAIENISRWY